MAARVTNRFGDKWRAGIRASMLRNRLENHALGEVEMTATQVRAAEILLKKIIPDLSSVEHSGEVAHKTVRELSDAELIAIAAGRSAGDTEAESGENVTH